MGLWDGIKNWFTRKGKKDTELLLPGNSEHISIGSKPLDAFSARLHEQAKQNLTLEQLCNKFATEIGIPREVLNLPGATQFIADNVLNIGKDVLKLNGGVDNAIKQFQLGYQVKRGLGGKFVITKKDGNNEIVTIAQSKDNISIKSNVYTWGGTGYNLGSTEERRYDKNTRIEILREQHIVDSFRENSRVITYLRDPEHIEKVQCIYSDNVPQIKDISMIGVDSDIATLDNLKFACNYEQDSSNLERHQQRVRKKINASVNRSGCYKYAGIEEAEFQK